MTSVNFPNRYNTKSDYNIREIRANVKTKKMCTTAINKSKTNHLLFKCNLYIIGINMENYHYNILCK